MVSSIEPYSPIFYTILAFTLVTVCVKIGLIAFLGRKLILKRKEGLGQGANFIMVVLFLMIGLLLSRVFYIIFDYNLTLFDAEVYTYSPNIWIWKLASAISVFGSLPIFYYIDKRILAFKLRGIPTILLFLGGIVTVAYPVREGVQSDFQIISLISLFTAIGALLIPIVFGYIAVKTPGDMRKIASMIVIGLILYAIGGTLVNEGLLAPLKENFGNEIQIWVYLLSTGLKSIGLSIFAVGSSKFNA
jgi:hypothetical protein